MDTDIFAIYLRKSRKDLENKDYDVLKRHRKILLDFAKSKNIVIHEEDIYEEVVSGETIQDRPVIQNLLKKIEVGYYKAVLVMEIERLARGNTIDQGIIAQAFQLTNTLIITPQKTYDTRNEFDNEFLEFGLFMSRREYKAISRRIQTGRIQSCKEGNYIGSVTPYGYDKEKLKGEKGYKLTPNDEAENVKLIFDLFLDGLGTSTLAFKLNDLNIKSRTGKPWTPAMVRNILTNKIYIGILTWGKRANVKKLDNNLISKTRPVNHNCIESKGKHDPIIDELTFYKAQTLLKSNSSKKVPKDKALKNPLAGIIVCKKCGTNMIRRPLKNIPDTILCKNHYCDNISSYLYLIEKRLLDSLHTTLLEYYYYLDNYEKEDLKSKKNYDIQIRKIDKDINTLKKQHVRTCELLELGVYSLELFKERSTSINEQVDALIKQKDELIRLNKDNKTEKIIQAIPKIENCLKTYHTLSIEDKNKLLKSIIKKAYYLKTATGGRWNKEAQDNFSIELELNL
ncbi:recombinase family protein [Clostridium paraputrificum]|uniref:recombinase family protein n=1 Tax=Clostridium paraputrificum TaxID=29363 RepID=UPI000C067F7C|nr:recombinase family protein [Clostridium paraputrificum]